MTLNEAKAHLRILSTDDDLYIQALIDVAEAQAEEITSRNLSETSNVFYLGGFKQSFTLPKSPLIAVDSIEYMPTQGGAYETIPSSKYEVNDVAEPAEIRFLDGISVACAFKAIKVSYRSGYAADKCPKPIKQWVLLRVATMYEYREELATIEPKAIANDYNDFLISKYKVRWL